MEDLTAIPEAVPDTRRELLDQQFMHGLLRIYYFMALLMVKFWMLMLHQTIVAFVHGQELHLIELLQN